MCFLGPVGYLNTFGITDASPGRIEVSPASEICARKPRLYYALAPRVGAIPGGSTTEPKLKAPYPSSDRLVCDQLVKP